MKRYFTLFISIFILSTQGIAQDVVVASEKEYSSTLKNADQLPLVGTYQIIVDNEDIVTNITEAILLQVKAKRESNTISYIIINDYVKIKILSYKVINSQGFIPLKEFSYEE